MAQRTGETGIIAPSPPIFDRHSRFLPIVPAFSPVIPAFSPVIPAFSPVIPAFSPVIPAKAGIQMIATTPAARNQA